MRERESGVCVGFLNGNVVFMLLVVVADVLYRNVRGYCGFVCDR